MMVPSSYVAIHAAYDDDDDDDDDANDAYDDDAYDDDERMLMLPLLVWCCPTNCTPPLTRLDYAV